jgi:hypothetical protein
VETDNDQDSQVNGTVAVTVLPGETWTCTFNNTRDQGSITIRKVTDPAGATGDNDIFNFSGAINETLGHDQSETETVDTGEHTVTEASEPGWLLTDITCSDFEQPEGEASTGVLETRTATFHVAKGEDVICTFTNALIETGGDIAVQLDVDKQLLGTTQPASGTAYTVHVSCTGDATVEEDLTFTYPNGLGVQSITEQIDSLGEFSCTVTETNPGGATLVGYKTDGGGVQQGAPTIVLSANRTNASVTVVNDPTIEVGGITVLPFTGSATAILLKTAVWLLVLGGVAWLITRRRRETRLG